MAAMSVTLETFQEEMSWSKEVAKPNVPDMLVTDETSQSEMPPLKAEADSNMRNMLGAADRLGESVALYVMFEAPRNASSIVDHRISPHWSMDLSRDAVEPEAPRFMRASPAPMLT